MSRFVCLASRALLGSAALLPLLALGCSGDAGRRAEGSRGLAGVEGASDNPRPLPAAGTPGADNPTPPTRAGSAGTGAGAGGRVVDAGPDGDDCNEVELSFASRTPSVFILVDRSSSMFERGLWSPLKEGVLAVVEALDDEVRFGFSSYTGAQGMQLPGAHDGRADRRSELRDDQARLRRHHRQSTRARRPPRSRSRRSPGSLQREPVDEPEVSVCSSPTASLTSATIRT